jgi:hypothetical protein
MLSATTRRIGPHPVPEERQVEPFRTPGTNIAPLAPIVPDHSPHGVGEIDVTRKVEPDDGFGSRQTKVEVGRVLPSITHASPAAASATLSRKRSHAV